MSTGTRLLRASRESFAQKGVARSATGDPLDAFRDRAAEPRVPLGVDSAHPANVIIAAGLARVVETSLSRKARGCKRRET